MPTSREIDALVLKVTDFKDFCHWRWRLTDANGKVLADHQVELDSTDVEYAGFLDLEGYLKEYAAPDKWPDDEVRLIKQVGIWIGKRVLGPVGTSILDYGTPVTVRVVVPEEASAILYHPLELAYVQRKSLALQDVSLVFEVPGKGQPVRPQPVGDRLRMLAVFSLPTGTSAVGLRRERYELQRLMHRIAHTHDLAIELRVLQYGVTRNALRDILEEGEGWDIVHFSGHGLPARFVLEQRDGTQDVVKSDQLKELLCPARGRLKLVTLSSCLSAAATLEETLHWLGISEPKPAPATSASEDKEQASVPALAHALVRDLDCAVLAMRYPVGDDFAINLAAELYEGMLRNGQQLTRALQLALPKTAERKPYPGVPPLSVATPALFGGRAVDLTLGAPSSAETKFTMPTAGLADFPPEPERFVGRIPQMSRASNAMAPKGDNAGVLFYGMAGGGKTCCALELTYRYRSGRFQGFVWHKAPDQGSDIEGALASLALDMENQLPGLSMIHVVDRADEFANWLPKLTELLEQSSILIVLDNLESLLTAEGAWRDERWGQLVRAMLDHRGLSRVVVTSRRRPAELGEGSRVQVEAIYSLLRDEAVLLARELPNLGQLLRGDAVGLERGRQLVARTLEVVQGHPKLIDFAERQAKDPKALETHLERAAESWTGGKRKLEAFFSKGESPFEAEEFLKQLADWTHAISAVLPSASRTLFHFLCALEESDRQTGIVKAVWPNLWKCLSLEGEVPDLTTTLEPLTTAGLVEAQAVGDDQFAYNIHPSIAETGQAEADDQFQTVVNKKLAAFWATAFTHSLKDETDGGGGLVVQAGRSAAPYLMRLQRWDKACALIDQVIYRDDSPATIAAVLPLLRRIVRETEETKNGIRAASVLASALVKADLGKDAETMLRDITPRATEQGEFRLASSVTTDLINILRATGRYQEALDLVKEMKGYTRRAGLGPWTQLIDESMRLQILNQSGQYPKVLSEVDGLREQMSALPEQSEKEEAVEPWNVREVILDCAHTAALRLERWQTAIDLNAEIVAITEARAAPALAVARTRFNNYGSLLAHKRYNEARALLHACRAVFKEEKDSANLGKVLSALAELEDELAHFAQAVDFEKTAVRYKYLTGDPDYCSISHHNLSSYLERGGEERSTIMAHRLAAVLINFQTQSGLLAFHLRNLALDFVRSAPKPPPLPVSFDELCSIVEKVEGVYFQKLFECLPRRAPTGDEAMKQVLAMAKDEFNKLQDEKQDSKEENQ